MIEPIDHAVLIYDGDCPVCSRYVKLLRLRENTEKVDLVNAREGGAIVQDAMRRGFDLDEGLLLVRDGAYYRGGDAMHVISSLTARNGMFNRLNAALFRSRLVAGLLYPALRVGRNLTLRLLGRTRIRSAP